MQRDFGPNRYAEIPPHGRWEHFSIGGVTRLETLVQVWQDSEVDDVEITRRLIDLFFVSVLLDAGAGDTWAFREPGSDKAYGRSEGIAVASLYMFNAGAFNSATDGNKSTVDGTLSPLFCFASFALPLFFTNSTHKDDWHPG